MNIPEKPVERQQMPQRPVLQGTKVILRPITMEDTERIVRWRNDPQVQKKFIYRQPFTAEGHIQWMQTKVATGAVVQYMIVEQQTGRPVGSVYYRDIDAIHNSAEFGIFIGELDARGVGLGTETARLFVRFGFETLGLHRIYLRVLAENIPARKSYEKGGFRTEGFAREMVYLDGEYHDVVFMAVLNSDPRGEITKE